MKAKLARKKTSSILLCHCVAVACKEKFIHNLSLLKEKALAFRVACALYVVQFYKNRPKITNHKQPYLSLSGIKISPV
jgi:hypothetical protein